MRIIALMNQKGGVGKTTTTVNLGAALAELGKRVCLIDLDPQAHLTINYGVEPSPDTVTLYNVLVEGRSFLEAVHKVDDYIALVPGSIDLAAAEVELVSVLGRETLLKKRVEAATHDFDFILLDCPPSLGLLTLNALAVANEVLVPMQPHFLALQGVAKLLETVQLVNKRMNPNLKVSGIVLTMFDAQTKLSSEVVNELNGFIGAAQGKPLPWASAKVYKTKIRRNIKLAESPSFGQHIIKYDPLSNGSADYRALAREVLGLEPLPAPVPAAAKNAAAVTPAAAAAALPAKPAIDPAKVSVAKAAKDQLSAAKAEIAAARARVAAAKAAAPPRPHVRQEVRPEIRSETRPQSTPEPVPAAPSSRAEPVADHEVVA